MPDTTAAEPFATVEDLEARWHPLTQAEQPRAETLLEDATQLIKDECPRWESASAQTRMAVCCSIVIRKMTVDDTHLGVTNSQQTVGNFSESFTYSNPMGDLYLTKAEKRRLGNRQGAWHVDTDPHDPQHMGVTP